MSDARVDGKLADNSVGLIKEYGLRETARRAQLSLTVKSLKKLGLESGSLDLSHIHWSLSNTRISGLGYRDSQRRLRMR
jgi:hypothetical protein